MKKKVLFSGILLAFQVLLGHAQQRLLGGDISLLPSYEAAGTVYRNAVGEPVAPLDFFKLSLPKPPRSIREKEYARIWIT